MTFPERNNPYAFDAFLQRRSAVDYYADDPFIQRLVHHFAGENRRALEAVIRDFSPKPSFRWRDMADESARPENRPYVLHYDAHNHRVDRLVRPLESRVMEQEVFAEALFSAKTSALERLVKMYLIYQNGEACTACPLVCTEGLVAILDAFGDTPAVQQALSHCREGNNGHFAIGAQYLTEIQGGSDVPANVLEAVQDGENWYLYGTKFFCSATHADYAVVTAKPTGSEKVGVFLVPSWLPGKKEEEVRNGCTIDRLKWKMGTSELPTAEMTFNGALAYPVGPFDRGLANIVGIVLTCSRLTVGLSSAASMTRAAREARQYSEFREAFGQPLDRFPMVAAQINDLEYTAKRTTAAAFKIYQAFTQLDGPVKVGIKRGEEVAKRRRRFDVRELVMLQKITASWDTVDHLRLAMSIFGGHGVMEDFSSLPRLYRDAAVNELWEGPRNVLLTQIHRDLQQAREWYSPADFVAGVLKGAEESRVSDLQKEIDVLVGQDLSSNSSEAVQACRQWDDFCHRLFHAYQDQAYAEIG